MSDFDGAAAVANHDELWYAQVAADDVRTMTLEQLDEAFQAGAITELTYVCQVGSSKWETLADVAGIEPETTVGAAPADTAFTTVPAFAAVTASAAPPLSAPFPQPTVTQGPAQPFPSMHLSTNSTAPVAADIGDMDIDVDVTPVEFRSKKGRAAVWISAAAAVGAIAFGVVRARTPVSVQLPPMPPGAALAPPPPVDLVGSALAAVAPAAVGPAALAEDTKKALAQADKTLATKQKASKQRRQETRVASPRRRTTKADQPFHKGGNRYDPLNSSL
jgi:hypothetical protein